MLEAPPVKTYADDPKLVAKNPLTHSPIWTGDNLDILRGLNSECVDLIYLDPPFNSNQNYSAPIGSKAAGTAFKDTWTLSDLDSAWMGIIAGHPSEARAAPAAQIPVDASTPLGLRFKLILEVEPGVGYLSK